MEKKITLFNLAIPIFGELVLFVMLGIVDVIMLTKVSDQAAGAVGATNQIISFIGSDIHGGYLMFICFSYIWRADTKIDWYIRRPYELRKDLY
jgi:Na+-driven multidrug efflux pump